MTLFSAHEILIGNKYAFSQKAETSCALTGTDVIPVGILFHSSPPLTSEWYSSVGLLLILTTVLLQIDTEKKCYLQLIVIM